MRFGITMVNTIRYSIVFLVFGGILTLLYSPLSSLAGERMTSGDPMVKITTLPTTIDLKQAMAKISEEVAKNTGLPETFVTYYWQFFQNMYILLL